MNTTVFPEIRPKALGNDQVPLPLAPQGVQRYVWDNKFGSILIEMVDGKTFVSGELVEPALP